MTLLVKRRSCCLSSPMHHQAPVAVLSLRLDWRLVYQDIVRGKEKETVQRVVLITNQKSSSSSVDTLLLLLSNHQGRDVWHLMTG